MNRPLVAVLFFVAACSRAVTPDTTAKPEPSTRPIANERRDAAPAPSAAWNDRPAIDALLRAADLPTDDKDPRSCSFEMPQQSCVPGPEAVAFGCRSDCSSACGGCASDCRKKIESCLRACPDEACGRACGKDTGACAQACLAARDRCATGCNKVVADYMQEVRSNYGCKDKLPALKICKRTVACIEACDKKPDPEACAAGCKKTLAAGCHEPFLQNVEMHTCMPYEDPI